MHVLIVGGVLVDLGRSAPRGELCSSASGSCSGRWARGSSWPGSARAFNPEAILGVEGAEAFVVTRELGFANLAMGILGMGSLLVPESRAPLTTPRKADAACSAHPVAAAGSSSCWERPGGLAFPASGVD
jgi:hypothetical protein